MNTECFEKRHRRLLVVKNKERKMGKRRLALASGFTFPRKFSLSSSYRNILLRKQDRNILFLSVPKVYDWTLFPADVGAFR